MTTLGKILVIVNLVLSVAVGALIVMSYVGRTNWHLAFVAMDQKAKDAAANTLTYQNEIENMKTQLQKAVVTAQEATKKATDSQSDKTTEVDSLKKANTQLTAQIQQKDAVLAANQQELDSKNQENKYLRDLKNSSDIAIRNKERENQVAVNEKTEAQIARRQTQERNESMLRRIEELEKEKQVAKQNGGVNKLMSTSAKNNPPADDVEGLVTETTADGLLSLSIGSDDGLKVGNTLELYRLKPESKYLGTVEILQVDAHTAVARPVGRVGKVLVGDTVASKVVIRR